jgi:DNA-binding MarR family transcriptional regulator
MSQVSPALVGATCSCLAMRRAARLVARRYDEALRPVNLNNGQFALLAAVAGLGASGIQMIGEQLGMDRTTVTAALKPLQRRNLLAVAVADRDQRGRTVQLTAAGRALLEEALPLWRSAQAGIAGELGGEAAAEALRNQLSRLT